MSEKPILKLEYLGGPNEGGTIELKAGKEYKFGRHSEMDYQFTQEGVSRYHCIIYHDAKHGW